jgi:hypothetical protein
MSQDDPMSLGRPSTKWRRIAALYKHFTPYNSAMDFSEAAAADAYAWESQGAPKGAVQCAE